MCLCTQLALQVERVEALTRRVLCSWSLCRISTSRSCFLWASSSCQRSKRQACQTHKLCCSCRIRHSRGPTWLVSLLRRRLAGDATERSLSTCCFCCCHMRPCTWLEMSRCGNSSRSKGRSSFSFTFTGKRNTGRKTNGRSQTGMWRIPILKTFKNE